MILNALESQKPRISASKVIAGCLVSVSTVLHAAVLIEELLDDRLGCSNSNNYIEWHFSVQSQRRALRLCVSVTLLVVVTRLGGLCPLCMGSCCRPCIQSQLLSQPARFTAGQGPERVFFYPRPFATVSALFGTSASQDASLRAAPDGVCPCAPGLGHDDDVLKLWLGAHIVRGALFQGLLGTQRWTCAPVRCLGLNSAMQSFLGY